jgi:Mn-dependent DtxR family transcriptional regulator
MQNLSNFKYLRTLDTSVSGRLLYLVLSEISGADNTVTVSQRRVSEALGVSKQTVSRNLRRLKEDGYIDIYSQYHADGGRAANKFVIK